MFKGDLAGIAHMSLKYPEDFILLIFTWMNLREGSVAAFMVGILNSDDLKLLVRVSPLLSFSHIIYRV